MDDRVVNGSRDRCLWYIVGAGFCLRLIYAFWAEVEPWSDFDAYHRMAQNIIDGKGWHSRGLSAISPGYPIFLAPVYLVHRSLEAVWIVNSVLGTLSIWFTYLLSLELWQKRSVARLASVGVAVYPDLVVYAGLLASENLAIPFFVLSVVLLLRSRDKERHYLWLLAGVFMGVAILARGMMLGLVPVYVAWIWWDVCGKSVKRALKPCLLLCLGSSVVIGPWTVRNYVVHDALVPVSTVYGHALWGGNNPEADGEWMIDFLQRQTIPTHLSEVERSRYQARQAYDYILERPLDAAWAGLKKFGLFWGIKMDGIYTHQGLIPGKLALAISTIAQASIVALFLLGLGASWPWSRELRSTLLMTAYLCVVTVLFYYHTRYRLLLYPLWMPVAVPALLGLKGRLMLWRRSSIPWYGMAIGILLFLDWVWIVWRNLEKVRGFSAGSFP